jgi:ABC-type xylose transport system permease subunit
MVENNPGENQPETLRPRDTLSRGKTGVKLIALLLIIGGTLGAAYGFWGELQSFRQIPAQLTALEGLFVMLFGWCAWTGFDLWKDKPKAFTNAKIIFLAQILNFTVPGFSFDGFYTGLRAYLMLSERAPYLRFGFNLQSMLYFRVSPEIDYWLVGINFVAVVAFFHLVTAAGPAKAKPDRFGLL